MFKFNLYDFQEKHLDSLLKKCVDQEELILYAPTGERVIIVMGAVCVIKPRVSGTLTKYISCIA